MDKNVLFIFGCQRSGTTATINGLQELDNVKVFREVNEVIHKKAPGKFNIRLKPFNKLKEIFSEIKEDLIVVKPLVESQNAVELLDAFPGSKGIWMYRKHEEVIASMIKKWGKNVGKTMLRSIRGNDKENWRSEKTEHMQDLVTSINIKKLSPESAACLFWYIRNTFYFKQDLFHDNRMLLCSYNNLIELENYLTRLLVNLNLMDEFVTTNFYRRVTSSKPLDNSAINAYIKYLCADQYDRLVELEDSQIARLKLLT